MQEHNLLDTDNDIHIFALQYIFLPRINMALNKFIEAWKNHALSTEGNISPMQL